MRDEWQWWVTAFPGDDLLGGSNLIPTPNHSVELLAGDACWALNLPKQVTLTLGELGGANLPRLSDARTCDPNCLGSGVVFPNLVAIRWRVCGGGWDVPNF